jgi:DNA-binding transcriptional LysR family regulator
MKNLLFYFQAAIEAFVQVAETNSFSEAARRLRTSKSVISRQVSSLEAELGARLFHRTTRSLTMTEAGQGYFGRVGQILADLAEANLAVTQLQSAPRGTLRINAPMSFGFLHLARALPDFMARYPEVELDVSMTDRFVDLVDEGFDLAVRIAALQDSSLIARRLAPIRLVVCASPDYLKQHGTPLMPQDLRTHACIVNSNIPSAREWKFLGADGKPLSVKVESQIAINNGDALRVAALGGLGLTILPTFIVGRDLQAGALVSVLSDYLAQPLGLHAVYPHARHLSPKVRAFVDFLAERFGPYPYWDLVE